MPGSRKIITFAVSLTLVAYNLLFPFASVIKALGTSVNVDFSFASSLVVGDTSTLNLQVTNNTSNPVPADSVVNFSLTLDSTIQDYSVPVAGEIIAGDTQALTTQVTLPSVAGIYTITSKITSATSPDVTPELNQSLVTVSGGSLSISTTAGNALLGEDASINLSVKNTGDAVAKDLSLQVILPTGLSFVSASVPNTTLLDPVQPQSVEAIVGGTKVTWPSFLDLATSETYSLNLKLAVAANLTLGTELLTSITATATTGNNVSLQALGEQNIKVEGLRATTQTPGEILLGESNPSQVSTNINIANGLNLAPTSTISLQQILTSGLNLITDSVTVTGASIVSSSSKVEFATGNTIINLVLENLVKTLPINISYAVTSLLQNNLAAANLHNQEESISTQVNLNSPQTLTAPELNLSTSSNSTTKLKHIQITKSVSPSGNLQPGDVQTVTLTVTTDQYHTAANVTVQDTVPAGFTLTSSPSTLVSGPDASGLLVFNLGDVAPSTSTQIEYTLQLNLNYISTELVAAADFAKTEASVQTESKVDNASVATQVQKPEVTVQSRLVGDVSWNGQISATPGSTVEVRYLVTFPSAVPTNTATLRIQKVPYVQEVNTLVSQVPSITGSFSGSPLTLSDFGYKGVIVNLGTVQPGSTWEVAYTGVIQNAPGVKAGTLLKSLATLQYSALNMQSQLSQTALASSITTIKIVEPSLNITKQVTGGLLFPGQTATIKTTLKNVGGYSAYNVSLQDLVPNNTVVMPGSWQASASCISLSDQNGLLLASTTNCNLAPGESVNITYQVSIPAGQNPETNYSSNITTSEYQNCQTNIPECRNYNAVNKDVTWNQYTDTQSPTATLTLVSNSTVNSNYAQVQATASDNTTVGTSLRFASYPSSLNLSTLDLNNLAVTSTDFTSVTNLEAVTRNLYLGEISANYTVCAQARDLLENLSAWDCKIVTRDSTAPNGNVIINAGAAFTNSKNVTLSLTAQDSTHSDGSAGIGGVQYALSYNGVDFTDYKPLVASLPWELKQFAGSESVYVKYKDALGNESAVFTDTISFNPYPASSGVVINQDAVFTNTETVTLDLNPTKPANKMRIYNLGQDTTNIAIEPFQTVKNWNVSPELGVKTVIVEYFNNTTQVAEAQDSIILAPKYAITYSPSFVPQTGSYNLNTLPTQLSAGQIVNVSVKLENSGSLTWQPQTGVSGETPVSLSYHWYYADGVTPYRYNGARSNLPYSVSYNGVVDPAVLEIYTPDINGEFVLKIDAVHEGITWFSEQGNTTPTYKVTISGASVLGEATAPSDITEEQAYGGTSFYTVQASRPWDPNFRCGGYDCLAAIAEQFYNCSARGIPNDAPYWVTIYTEQYVQDKCWYPIFNANRNLYDGAYIPYAYVQRPWNYINPGWVMNIPNVADTWIASLQSVSHGGNVTIKQGESVSIALEYINTGTGNWTRPGVRLAIDFNNASIFQDSTWISSNRTVTYSQNTKLGPTGLATFNPKLTAKLNQTPGTYTECFKVVYEGVAWLTANPTCYTIKVIARDLPTGNIFCTLGTDILNAPSGSVIGNLSYNSTVTAVEPATNGFIKIQPPSGVSAPAYVAESCFNQTGTVTNGAESSASDTTPRPTGNTGVVIATTGLKLRYGPSLKFGSESTLPYGTTVQILRKTNNASSEGLGEWYEVQLPDGRTGFLPSAYVDSADGFTPAVFSVPTPAFKEAHTCGASSIQMLWSPNAASAVIETLTPGTNVRVIEVIGDYMYVSRISGKSGYIQKSGLCEKFELPSANYGSPVIVNGVPFARPINVIAPVSSGFGDRYDGYHNGTDYAVSCGTDIFAAAKGRVIEVGTNGVVAGNSSNYSTPANYIKIDHGNAWQSWYWHLNTVAVEVGMQVEAGAYIGKSGNTGYVRGSDASPLSEQGCHLHFELRENGIPRDPEYIFNYKPSAPAGGNVSGVSNFQTPTTTTDVRNDFNTSNNASLANPYGSANSTQSTDWPELQFDRWIELFGTYKGTALKSHKNLQAPKLTLVKTAEDGKSVTVYGTALPKNSSISMGVWNEYRTGLHGTWEYKWQQVQAQNVKVVLFKNNPDNGTGWQYLGETWMGYSDKFEISLPLNANLKVGDNIFAEVQLSGQYQMPNNTLHWWHDTYDNGATFNIPDTFYAKYKLPYWPSGAGNSLTVAPRWIADPVERAFTKMQDSIGGNYNITTNLQYQCGLAMRHYSTFAGYTNGVTVIYNPANGNANFITGGIAASYWNRGGCAKFGAPTNNPGNVGGSEPGWYQNFEGGTIYWSQNNLKSQPGIVTGAIREYYHNLGGTWSKMGFPESESWSATSQCGTKGDMQHFSGGKLYLSTAGTVFVPWSDWNWINHFENVTGGVTGSLGFPKTNKQNNNGTERMYFETGILTGTWYGLHWGLAMVTSGCSTQTQSDKSYPDQTKVTAIQNAESTLFSLFTRADRGTGNGAIHNYCNTAIVDYSNAILKDGTVVTRGIMMVNNGNAYLLANYQNEPNMLDAYFNKGGCDVFGLAVGNVAKIPGVWQAGYQRSAYKQSFTNADLYQYWQPMGIGSSDVNKSYQVTGAIRERLNKFSGEGDAKKIGLPTSDPVQKSSNLCNQLINGYVQYFYHGVIYNPTTIGAFAFTDIDKGYGFLTEDPMIGTYKSRGEMQVDGWVTSEIKYDLNHKKYLQTTNSVYREVDSRLIPYVSTWGCDTNKGEQTLKDLDSTASEEIIKSIQAKENSIYQDLNRVAGIDGGIHEYACGNIKFWGAKSSSSKKFDGTTESNGLVMYINNTAFHIADSVLEKYLSTNCSAGAPVNNYESFVSMISKKPGYQQYFENGIIVSSYAENSAQLIQGDIANIYKAGGGANGLVGFPVKDNGVYQFNGNTYCSSAAATRWSFENAKMYQVDKQPVITLFRGNSLEYAYYLNNDVNGTLGWPISGMYSQPDNMKRIDFEKGKIVEEIVFLGSKGNVSTWACGQSNSQRSNDDTSLTETAAIWRKEQELFNDYTRTSAIKPFCSNSMYIAEYTQTVRKNSQTVTSNSQIIVAKNNQAFFLEAGIADYYKANCAKLGLPKSDRFERDGGYYQQFENGYIVESQSGTYSVLGALGAEYAKNQRVWITESLLGHPTAEQESATSACGTPGFIQKFQNGRIYSSGVGTYAFENTYPAKSYFEAGPSILGWPITLQHEFMFFWGAIDTERGIVYNDALGSYSQDLGICTTGGITLGNGQPKASDIVEKTNFDPTDSGEFAVGDEFYNVQNQEVAIQAPSTEDYSSKLNILITSYINKLANPTVSNTLSTAVSLTAGLIEGLTEVVVDIGKGLYTLAQSILTNPGHIPEMLQGFIGMFEQDPIMSATLMLSGKDAGQMVTDLLNMGPDEQAREIGRIMAKSITNAVLILPGMAKGIVNGVAKLAEGIAQGFSEISTLASKSFTTITTEGLSAFANKAVAKLISLGGILLTNIQVGVTNGLVKIGEIAKALYQLPGNMALEAIMAFKSISGGNGWKYLAYSYLRYTGRLTDVNKVFATLNDMQIDNLFKTVSQGIVVDASVMKNITSSVIGLNTDQLIQFIQAAQTNPGLSPQIFVKLYQSSGLTVTGYVYIKDLITGDVLGATDDIVRNAVAFAKDGKVIDLSQDAVWLANISGDASVLSTSHLNAARMIASKGVQVLVNELPVLLANASGDLSLLDKARLASFLETAAKGIAVDVGEYLDVWDRAVNHIGNGEFPNGLYKFAGLHDYDKFISTRDAGLIDPAYVIDDAKSIFNPDGVSEVIYNKVTNPTKDLMKSLLPRGTTTGQIVEAGYILKNDFDINNIYELLDITDPDYASIFSKSKYFINGKHYYIQGYRTIANPSNSSWWLVENIPLKFQLP